MLSNFLYVGVYLRVRKPQAVESLANHLHPSLKFGVNHSIGTGLTHLGNIDAAMHAHHHGQRRRELFEHPQRHLGRGSLGKSEHGKIGGGWRRVSNVKKERRKGAGAAAPEKAGTAQETREARVVAVLYTCTAARITTFVFFAVGMLREPGRAF